MSKNPIPSGALDRHIAFLGATGSGKTSGAKSGIVEPALVAGERVIVLDPTAAWWGLRLGHDGKSKGFPIYIFGGDHGDYPLRSRDAEILAEAFGTSSDSAEAAAKLLSVLTGPQRKLVDAALSGGSMTREQLATTTDYSAGSGGFNNLIGSLCTLDVLRKPAPGLVEISDWAAEVLS